MKEKLRLTSISESIGYEGWAVPEGPGDQVEGPGDVIPFPRAKRPPPPPRQRGSIGNPRLPDDVARGRKENARNLSARAFPNSFGVGPRVFYENPLTGWSRQARLSGGYPAA